MNLLSLFGYITILAFLIRSSRNIFYNIFLWQLKEYRIDRIKAHLKTQQGKKLILGPLTIIKWILFTGILYGIFVEHLESHSLIRNISYVSFWVLWIVEALLNLRELIFYRWRLPQFTIKIVITLFVVFAIIFQIIFDQNSSILLGKMAYFGPFIDRFNFLIIISAIILINFPAFLYRKFLTSIAKRKILKLNNLIVIGITGSYGKTSTKEFLATILSEKFKVVKTPGFNNTDIGIARCILKELKPEHEVFIVEMGAYKKGEIKTICDMVKPKIGIITGINEQHLELFGSIKNTQKAKFELIESLPKDGIAIFNGSNKYCLEMAKWTNTRGLKIFTFKTATDVKNIRVFQDHIEFIWIDKNKSCLLKINLLGKQSIENVLAAIYAAKSLGLTIEEIQKGASKIVPPAKTMQFAGQLSGMMLVDDTFNANSDGVLAAVNFMKSIKGKKMLALTPLIELGEEAEKIHAKLGEELAIICDLILLTNFNYSKSFISGAKKVSGEAKIQIVNTSLGVRLIRENLDKDGIVVFEGKEAGRILQQLTINN